MRPKSNKVFLTKAEREQLEKFVSIGTASARLIRRAYILLALDENNGSVGTQAEIAAKYACGPHCVYLVARDYKDRGLNGILTRKKRETPPVPAKITGDVEAHIIQLACSAPPDGRAKWTLRLLAEKIVELEIVESIVHGTVGKILKKRLKTTPKENVVHSAY